MIEKEREEFIKYVDRFDLSIEAIKMKKEHTLRVVEYAGRIIEDNYPKRLKELCLLGALLHDIARFKQWTEYETYKDADSFDHGDMAYEILKNDNYIENYVTDEYEKSIILNAVKQHNKKDLDLKCDEWMDTVAKVVRDADKLDILVHQYNFNDINKYLYKNYLNIFGSFNENQFDINDLLIDDIKNHRLCSNKNTISFFDNVLREIAFIFDLNYIKSFQIIKNEKIVQDKISLLKEYNKKDTDKINLIEKELMNFINNKIGDDIKC